MTRGLLLALAVTGTAVFAQERAVPRPPAQPQSANAGTTATDGYAPIPQWAGQTRAPIPAVRVRYKVETVAKGIHGGFSFHFLPDGRIIVGERPGRIRIIEKNGAVSEPLRGLPSMWTRGPQGLFEVLPDRNFAANRTLYLTYTVLPSSGDAENAPRLAGVLTVARARLSDDSAAITDVKTLLNAEGIGGRAVQARDGTLFVTSSIPAGVGIDSSDWPQPQQLDSLMGKVLRINVDRVGGSVPKDNPFVSKAGARPEIFAYGIRDDQGIAIHPRRNQLWTSEHGPRGGDEINVIRAGGNYGFPIIGYGREYNGKPVNGDRTAASGMEQPVYFWTPDIAPAGITFYDGAMFPAWRGDLFVAALAGKHLARLVLRGDRVVGEERLLEDLNTRIRDVREGPEGALYVMTDGNEGAMLRLVASRDGS